MSRLKQLLTFLDEDPTDSFVRFALAAEYVKLGRLDEGLDVFESLREDDPRYVGTYYHLGKLYERMDRPEDAAETYRAGMSMAMELTDFHSRSELQSALLELESLDAD
jgi:tetratricopeptide (TPR) repeat protein